MKKIIFVNVLALILSMCACDSDKQSLEAKNKLSEQAKTKKNITYNTTNNIVKDASKKEKNQVKTFEPYQGYITHDNVRVRKNPSPKSKTLGRLKIGTTIKVIEKSTKPMKVGKKTDYWYKCLLVETHNDSPLWVFGAFIGEGDAQAFREQHLSKLEKPEETPHNFKTLVGSRWVKNPNAVSKLIIFKSDNAFVYGSTESIGNTVYHIKTIEETNENEFMLDAALLYTPDYKRPAADLNLTIRMVPEEDCIMVDELKYIRIN